MAHSQRSRTLRIFACLIAISLLLPSQTASYTQRESFRSTADRYDIADGVALQIEAYAATYKLDLDTAV